MGWDYRPISAAEMASRERRTKEADQGGRLCGAAALIFRSDLLFQDQLASVLRADDLPILTAIVIALHLCLVVAVRLL